ncbi:hypothetical protein BC938DRAFT_471709, partial [Jimgerdemannia flammicorona]
STDQKAIRKLSGIHSLCCLLSPRPSFTISYTIHYNISQQVQDNTMTATSIRDKLDDVVKFLKNVSIRYGDESEQKQKLEELRMKSSDCKRKRKNNGISKEERNKLRATIIGDDYQAWDLSVVLKKIDNLRQQWVNQYLIQDDANGELLTLNMMGVFTVIQSLLKLRIKTIRDSMFDVKESPTNTQFIMGVLNRISDSKHVTEHSRRKYF